MRIEGQYDYIIVGAGTAGCVLANRLTEDPATRVLLLEAGGSDNYHWVHIPVGYLYCIGNPRTDWMMRTAAEPGLNGRSLPYPRGKILGGCSSVNGMIYMRGQAADYERWRQMGNVGWGWDDVLPYSMKSEDHHAGENAMHGVGGEWKVAKQRLSWEILHAVQAGASGFGVMPRDDFNDGSNEGSGFFEVNQKGGVRWNTAKAFSAAGAEAPQPARRHARRDRAAAVRRQARRGRAVPAEGDRPRSDGGGRSAARRRIDQLAQDSRALRHRTSRPTAESRHRCGARKPRRRREPAGPSADQDDVQGDERQDAQHDAEQPVGQAAHRPAICIDAERAPGDGAQPVRDVHQVRSVDGDARPRIPRSAAIHGPTRQAAASLPCHNGVGLQP
jgi:choline dehydrogenase-like flavoprotein